MKENITVTICVCLVILTLVFAIAAPIYFSEKQDIDANMKCLEQGKTFVYENYDYVCR